MKSLKPIDLALAVLLFAAITLDAGGLHNPAPLGPVTLAFKSVSVLTSGAPADLVTLAVPFSRWTTLANGTSTACKVVAESAAGTLAAGSLAMFDAAAGGGNQIISTTAGPTGTNPNQFATLTAAGVVSSSSTLVLRQMVNSGNAGVISGSITIIAVP